MSSPANERVRLVTAAALAAYTASGAGLARILTANANGVMSNVDGVAPVAGDQLLLVAGAAAADNGVYVVTSIGTAGAPFVLTRSPGFQQGTAQAGFLVDASEGTVFGNTQWKLMTTGAITLDTTALSFMPGRVMVTAPLVAGTLTVSSVPVQSATKTLVSIQRIVANTCTATTGGYCPTNGGANGITAGAIGTAAIIIQACAAAGTISNADISTICVEIVNW